MDNLCGRKHNVLADVSKLLSLLGTGDVIEVRVARATLAAYGEHAIDDLLTVLMHGSARQVANVVLVLGEIVSPQALEPLVHVLHTHPNQVIRANTAKALANYGPDPRVLKALADLLTQEPDFATQWAIAALGSIPGQQALRILLAYLSQAPDSTMRYTVIKALGERGDRRARRYILPYLDAPDTHVRDHARRALEKLDDPAANPLPTDASAGLHTRKKYTS